MFLLELLLGDMIRPRLNHRRYVRELHLLLTRVISLERVLSHVIDDHLELGGHLLLKCLFVPFGVITFGDVEILLLVVNPCVDLETDVVEVALLLWLGRSIQKELHVDHHVVVDAELGELFNLAQEVIQVEVDCVEVRGSLIKQLVCDLLGETFPLEV